MLGRVVGRAAPDAGHVEDLHGRLRLEPHGERVLAARGQNRRGGPVTEEDARGAVLPVHEAAHLLRRNDEHALRAAAREVAVRDVEGKDEARAGRRHVEGRAGRAEALGDGAGLGGDEVVAARGGADDEVKLVGRDAGRLEGAAARLAREVVERLGGADAAAPDAGPGENPLVRGIQELREVVVGDGARRKRRARSQNAESHLLASCLALLLTRQHLFGRLAI